MLFKFCALCQKRTVIVFAGFDGRRLHCGHCFHGKCISKHESVSSTRSCPICRKRYPSKIERRILDCPTTISKYINLKTVDFDLIYQLTDSQVLRDYICKKCDVTKTLIESIDSDRADVVELLARENVKINWFSTIDGTSIYDRAKLKGNPRIVAVLDEKFKGFVRYLGELSLKRRLMDNIVPSAPEESELQELDPEQ